MYLLFINASYSNRKFCTMYRLWYMSSHTSSVFMLCLMAIGDVVSKVWSFPLWRWTTLLMRVKVSSMYVWS